MNTPHRNELKEAFMQPIESTRIGEPVRGIDLLATPQESVRDNVTKVLEETITYYSETRVKYSDIERALPESRQFILDIIQQQREAAVREALEGLKEKSKHLNVVMGFGGNTIMQVVRVADINDLLATYTKSEGER